MVVGSRQVVGILQFKNFGYLSGIYKAVTAHHKLIGWHRRDNLLVKAHYLYQRATPHRQQASLLHRLPHGLIVCGHQ